MSQGLFPRIATELDLNGPTLSFTNNPVGVASTSGLSVTLSGFATAIFESTGTPDNAGSISYQWYEVGVGVLSDDTKFTGTGTTQLTISNLETPADNGREFFLRADYNPAPGQTGNAINDPLSSGIGTITVIPEVEIVAQPSNSQTTLNTDTTFTVDAGLTDSTFGGVTYQWQLNGEDIDDGVVIGEGLATRVEQNYTSDGSIELPSDTTDVEISVAGAAGGSGGYDAGGPGGGGGNGRAGKFEYADGARTLTFRLGRTGNGGGTGNQNVGGSGGASNVAGGGRGGGAGQNGWSGGGGGGGGATGVFDSVANAYTIVGAGGAGGGGGSHNVGASPAPNAGGYSSTSSPFSISGGGNGSTKNGDGGGGGAGGGGAGGGSGGGSGQDNSNGGSPGTPGGSKYNTTYATSLDSQWENNSNGFVNLKFTTNTTIPGVTVTTTKRTTVSGTKTPTLTIRTDLVGIQTVRCVVSSSIDSGYTFDEASNTPVLSEVVNFIPVGTAEQYNVNIEAIGGDSTAALSSINLFNGDYQFDLSAGDPTNNGFTKLYSIYSPDKDIEVEMDLYGGKGESSNGNEGGEGGYSRVRFTMTQNTEYVIAGLTNVTKAPFIYRKGTLIACVGSGGNAGSDGKGGAGGGINVDGENGFGRGNGNGGTSPDEGTLSSDGIFGSLTTISAISPDTKAVAPNGGRVFACTKGNYWASQGIAPCDDVTSGSNFRLSDGTAVTNTATTITRGYKDGYSIIQTAGEKTGTGGNGGNGATGGQGGQSGGGGGGSGYTNGEVTIVDNQLGGSDGDAKVIMRVVTS
jgi:hypothetical protein